MSEYSKMLNFNINYNLYPNRYNTEEAILKRGGGDSDENDKPRKINKKLTNRNKNAKITKTS